MIKNIANSLSTYLRFVLIVIFLPTAHAEDTRKYIIDPSTTFILEISVSSNEREIVDLLGKPKLINERYSDALDTNFRDLHYDGIDISFGDGYMWGLSCKAEKCETNLRLKIGDSKAMVVKKYGDGNPPYEEATRDSLRYPFEGCDCYLFFYFENNRVVEISYFFDYT